MDQRVINISAGTDLDDLEKVAFQVKWPRPVSERVDQLRDLGKRTKTDRSEVVAALLCSQEWTKEEVEKAVLKYRGLKVKDVVLGLDDAAQVVELTRHPPGRRRRPPSADR